MKGPVLDILRSPAGKAGATFGLLLLVLPVLTGAPDSFQSFNHKSATI